MIRSYAVPIFLLLSLLCTAAPSSIVSASSSSVQRTIIAEPYFQIYEDQFSLASAHDNYTVSFLLPYPQALYSAKAYGPGNSDLNVYVSWDPSRGNMSLLVETNGSSSFTLKTIMHYTTMKSNSTYTTFLNLYPAVEEEMAASLTLFLPSDSVLVGSPENLTLVAVDSKPVLVGTAILEPSAAYNETIRYNGSFELVEISSLEHRISVGQSVVTVTDSLQVVNLNTSAINKVTISLPNGATLVRVYDSIGYMNYTLSGSDLTISFRTRLFPTEKTSFTLVYELPAASVLEIQSGKSVLSGVIPPQWCPFLVRNLVAVVELPLGSSEVSAPGFQIHNGSSSIECWIQVSDATPYSGIEYSVSFVPAPYAIPVGSIVFAILISLAVLAVLAYLLIRRRKGRSQGVQTAPPQPPKPLPLQLRKGQNTGSESLLHKHRPSRSFLVNRSLL
ncbi:MAG: hypothetical protein QHG94_02655 [Candidatus Methanosuratincola sp.]|nr:hypothetical protein [Candidatus Methanosuratincola sp.]